MTNGAVTTPDILLVRLGARVTRMTADVRPGWWRIDPAICVRRADEIEIRAAALAAASNGGGSRLLAVLRAATLDGAATPITDAVMLALALGDTENPLPPSQAEDGWTRVRFNHATEPDPAEESGEDLAEWIEAMLARLASRMANVEEASPTREPRSATAPSFRSDLTPNDLRAGHPAEPEERTSGPAGKPWSKPWPIAQTKPAAPIPHNPTQPAAAATAFTAPTMHVTPTTHATLRHRRLVAKPAHARTPSNDPSNPDTAPVPPPALRDPAGSGITAEPTQSNQPTTSFPTSFFDPPVTDLATRPTPVSAPLAPDRATAKHAQPPSSFAPPPWFADKRPDNRSAPLIGHGSPGLDAPPPAFSGPKQAAPISALPDPDTLLSILARALVDECDHRGLDL